MKRSTALILVSALLVFVGAGLLSGSDAGQAKRVGKGTVTTPVRAPLTEEERQEMIFIREEEKLARDVYIEMSEIYKVPIFANIAASEQKHMDAVLDLLVRYGVPDPVGENAIGEFTDPALQNLYNKLIERGMQSVEEAYRVGVDIEVMDIQDLEEAIAITIAAGLEDAHEDIVTVYTNIKAGSVNHLAVFSSHLD